MTRSQINAELRKTQDFADKIKIKPYDQVQKNLNKAAAKTIKETAEWMFGQSERMNTNT